MRTAYIPFGAGPRMCIGRDFAYAEAVLSLAMICRAVRLAPSGPARARASPGDDPAGPPGADAGHAPLSCPTRAGHPSESTTSESYSSAVAGPSSTRPSGQHQRDRKPRLVGDDHAGQPDLGQAGHHLAHEEHLVVGRQQGEGIRAGQDHPSRRALRHDGQHRFAGQGVQQERAQVGLALDRAGRRPAPPSPPAPSGR